MLLTSGFRDSQLYHAGDVRVLISELLPKRIQALEFQR